MDNLFFILVFSLLLLFVGMCLSLVQERFFFSLVEDLIYAIKLDFLLINHNNSKAATFHDIPCCLYIPLLCFNFLHVFLIVWSSSSSLSLSPDVLFLQGSFYSSDFRLSFLVELSIPLYFSLSSPQCIYIFTKFNFSILDCPHHLITPCLCFVVYHQLLLFLHKFIELCL